MNKIINHGEISIPLSIIDNANSIKYDNYKTNTPKRFQIWDFDNGEDLLFLIRLSDVLDIEYDRLDFVYFSVCKGAEPHIDLLDPAVFEPRTFVIPVILPNGKSVITAEDETTVVALNNVYEFNHEKIHSMSLEDNESGCVVIMVAVKK
jgi:hypothetical protein